MLFKTSFKDEVFKILDTNSLVFHFVYVQFWFIWCFTSQVNE